MSSTSLAKFLARQPHNLAGLIAVFVAVSMIGGILAVGLVLPAAGASEVLTKNTATFFDSLPSELEIDAPSQNSRMLAADGSVITTFFEENRKTVKLNQISQYMQDAIVAIEDSRFREHTGVDPKGLVRAAIVNQITGSAAQGASTLTQQYVKNVLVDTANSKNDKEGVDAARDKTSSRKLQEIRYAVALEKKMTKDEILNGYLNIAAFGGTINGVEAAARYYFHTTAKKLTLAQAATLAGVVQLPGKYNPQTHPKEATTRRNVVLQRMLDLKFIDQKQHDTAVKTKLKTRITPVANGCANTKRQQGYYCEYVRQQIIENDGFSALGKTQKARANALKRGGLTIQTAMEPKVMTAAWNAMKSRIPPKDKSNVATASVTVEAGTGHVLSIQQNKTFAPKSARGKTSLNYAVDKDSGGSSGFQTGSTFKPFTLATWLDAGKSLNAVLPSSGGTAAFSEFTACNQRLGGGSYTYSNADEGTTGKTSMSVWDGTAASVNGTFVSMEKQLDLCKIRKMAESLGVNLAAPRNTSAPPRERHDRPAAELRTVPDLGGRGHLPDDHGRRLRDVRLRRQVLRAHRGDQDLAERQGSEDPEGQLSPGDQEGSCRRGQPRPQPFAHRRYGQRRRGAGERPQGLRQDRNHQQLGGHLVRRLHPAARDRGLGRRPGHSQGQDSAVHPERADHRRRLQEQRVRCHLCRADLERHHDHRLQGHAAQAVRPAGRAVPGLAEEDRAGRAGQEPAGAKSILEAADFEVAVSGKQEPSSYPAGSVASTSPGGGSSAAIGSTITLTLSSGATGGGPGNGDNNGDGNGGEIQLPGGGTIELPGGPGNGR